MDKSFAAVTGNVVTDWPRVIEQLPFMDPEEHAKYCKLSYQWPTCACGNQCAIIPRTTDPESIVFGSPDDDELAGLGARFPLAIEFRSTENARALWNAIEARSAVLIAEELAKHNA